MTDSSRTDTKNKMKQDRTGSEAEIKKIKETVSFQAPEIEIGGFDVKPREDEAEELTPKKTVEEKPKTNDEAYKRGLESLNEVYSNTTSSLYLSQYKQNCSHYGQDCPDISELSGPRISRKNNEISISSVPSPLNQGDQDKVEQLAVSIYNKYLNAYGDTKEAGVLAEAEFKTVSQLMANEGITADSPTFNRVYNLMSNKGSMMYGEKANENLIPSNIAKFVKSEADRYQTNTKQENTNTTAQIISAAKNRGRD